VTEHKADATRVWVSAYNLVANLWRQLCIMSPELTGT